MELRFDGGKYVKSAYGGFETVTGRQELVQRALMRLSARRGGFFPMPDFGSELHTLFSMKRSQRSAAARRMVYEALAPEKEIEVTAVDYRETGDGTAELESEGEQLDGVYARLELALREGIPAGAQDAGLEAYEEILPFVPSYITTADRRRAIAALLRIDMQSFTLQALNDTIAGCGIRALVAESDKPQTVRVSFPYNRGVPAGIEALMDRIEQILPCHLGVEYVFERLLWRELEAWFGSWAELEEKVPSWAALEVYLPEE